MGLRELLNAAYTAYVEYAEDSARKEFDHWLATGELKRASTGSADLRSLLGGRAR